jgi:hypothetical protein
MEGTWESKVEMMRRESIAMLRAIRRVVRWVWLCGSGGRLASWSFLNLSK